MKMTMHIDEDVLARVVKITGASTKTEAVEIALKEMARRHRMKELFGAGLGFTAAELRSAYDPGSLPDGAHEVHAVAAEGPAVYGKANPS
ncbi:MAG: type II toxin-antitoxin system VapB family antitoxin [Opitutaceae bacterium]|nr:type II toxin-antitoxin system VapB family antitoxin [Opitutaceae bacterium]